MNSRIGYTDSAQFKCIEDLKRDYVDLYLSYCGCENCRPGFGFGPDVRTEYVLHVITGGQGCYQTGSSSYSLSPGDVFLIYPGTKTYYQADVRDPWSYSWVGFNGVRAYECVTNAGFTPERPVVSVSCAPALADCVDQILAAHQITYANELLRTSLMLRFLSLLIGDRPDEKSYDYPGAVYVECAVNYMNQNYGQKIRIGDLAEYIGINRSYLTESFKKQFKVSPQEFLLNLRMEKAVSLLQTTSLPIAEIAVMVGYPDSLAFSKIFKQKFHTSPSGCRKTTQKLVTVGKKGDYGCAKPL